VDASLESLIQAAKARPRQGFRPTLDESHAGYRVRFASDEPDRERLFRMRFEVFNLELGEGLAESTATGLDRDPFDEQCDHLIVEEVASGRAVGTYRLQVAEMAHAGRGFYSATEFDLDALPPGVLDDSVELGRACIERPHRNKKVLFLLWRGLAAYALWNGRNYFLGCSSLTSQDPQEGLRCYDHLVREGLVHPDVHVPPLSGYACVVDGHRDTGQPYELPALFGTYLRYGAKLCGPPAIDRYFGTIDFLTLLDLRRTPARVFGMFFAGLEGAPR
jgi:putative hemolysin